MRFVGSILIVWILTSCLVCNCFTRKKKGHSPHHSTHKKSTIEHTPDFKKKSTIEHTPDFKKKKEWETKKSEIEAVTRALENGTSQHKDKRGFLATLANLLNDAEALTGHRNQFEGGLSSFTHSPVAAPSDPPGNKKSVDLNKQDSSIVVTERSDKRDMDTTKVSETESSELKVDQRKPMNTSNLSVKSLVVKKDSKAENEKTFPDPEDVRKIINDSSKDFAPIFAMYHGKIVPLGKLPDSSFKKTRAEDKPIDEGHVKDVTGDKRSLPATENKHITPEATINSVPHKRDGDTLKMSKLQQYLKNLDGHIAVTGDLKEHVVKDEVPAEQSGSVKSDILNHVKGLVLDNGKVVTVKGNHVEGVEENVKEDSPLEQQKYFVSEDGSLNPIGKSKSTDTDEESKPRDQTSEPKTVALSLDVLKDLLKKSDNKVSLATLLNRSPENSEKSSPTEEEDPGTIEDFAAGGLKAHNGYRLKHHDGPLIWSDDLAAKAQKLAESLADKKALEIAKDLEKEGYGENVAKVWATFKDAGEAATKMWYSESGNYRFDDPHLDENTGQFAQVVWKSTKELGMGVAKSIDDVNNKYVYVTALYRPPGNIETTLRDNVLPTGNNTVDVYTTFFKRAGVTASNDTTSLYTSFFKRGRVAASDLNVKRSNLQKDKPLIVKDDVQGFVVESEE